jgi:GT2 family glycosyltransferase
MSAGAPMPDDLGPRGGTLHQAGAVSPESMFDEAAYMAAFPDVAAAVQRGDLGSAAEHYRLAGEKEKRLLRPEYRRQLALANRRADFPGLPPDSPGFSIDAVVASASGAVFVAGWADDPQQRLAAVTAQLGGLQWRWTQFPRVRRADVESALSASTPYHYGFWLVAGPADGAQPLLAQGAECVLELQFAPGMSGERRHPVALRSDPGLRDLAMGYLAGSLYHGNHVLEGFAGLDTGAGDWLIGFNRAICRDAAAAASVERFGPARRRCQGSIVVPLHGIGDFLFVQNCLYAQGAGMADYEFVYVVNSPELVERLHREARIAEMVYGLSVSLVTLPFNAGFAVANNVGLNFARSDRLLCVNPDVFPRGRDWARRHTDLLAALPAQQTRFFGTSLFYDDGSLMHGGMYFEAETGIRPDAAGVTRRTILRVEHYGKGAPPWASQFVASRPVPAVTGAFMSIDRAWFESLGGFTEDYVFGHYEDADLCLKSLEAGTPVWLHDIPMWHMEGKGSRRLPAHEGGSLLNRWLFTRRWERVIVPDLVGQRPRRMLAAGADGAKPRAEARPRGRAPARAARSAAG